MLQKLSNSNTQVKRPYTSSKIVKKITQGKHYSSNKLSNNITIVNTFNNIT